MSVNWLKQAVKDAGAPKFSIVDVLRKTVGGWSKPRSMEVVHASDITKSKFCPRRWALMDLLSISPKDEYISTALQATFDVGLMTENLFVNKWAGSHAVGDWQCRLCDKKASMTTKPKPGCPEFSGGRCVWKYSQKNFVSKEYAVSGGIDLLMDLGGAKLFVVEIKILKVEDFEKIMAPLPEHRIRTSLYLKLIADSDSSLKDRINLHQAKVVYVSRGFGKKNVVVGDILPFKEFDVLRDDSVLERPLALAKQVKIFRETKAMPSGVCATAIDAQAKYCQVAKQCFSGAFPCQQNPLPTK